MFQFMHNNFKSFKINYILLAAKTLFDHLKFLNMFIEPRSLICVKKIYIHIYSFPSLK